MLGAQGGASGEGGGLRRGGRGGSSCSRGSSREEGQKDKTMETKRRMAESRTSSENSFEKELRDSVILGLRVQDTGRTCATTARRPNRMGSLNPEEALEAARAWVSRFEAALGVLGESDSAEAQTSGAALQRTHQGHGGVHREVNKQAPSSGEECSEEEQLLENATAPLGRRQVGSEVGRHGSGTR